MDERKNDPSPPESPKRPEDQALTPKRTEDQSFPPVWEGGKPSTFKELFAFYHGYVKLLYADVQTGNVLPQELLFEFNAALDHLARHWTYGESEASVVKGAYAHFKRGCLDVFKLKLKTARDQYDKLHKVDLSIIDNGEFSKSLKFLFAEVKKSAREARRLEGQTDTESNVPAFEAWEKVFVGCARIEDDFFHNPHVTWARKRGAVAFLQRHATGFAVGILASVVAAFIFELRPKQIEKPEQEVESHEKTIKENEKATQ